MFTLLTPLRLAAGLLAVYVLTLALGFGRDKGFLVEADGTRRAIEFIAVKAAGDLARSGRAADAYDWEQHKAAHDRALGKSTTDYFAWPYPPTYLPVADLLSRLPYVAAALAMIVVTGAFFARVGSGVLGHRHGALYALGAPPTMINAGIAHTGFLVAGLAGGALLILRTRPFAAGVLIGLLTFKPQLGVLLPFALVAGGHWRTIAAASLTALGMIALSIALYGVAPWLAMPAQLARVTTDILAAGTVNFDMLTTPYGLLRRLGATHAVSLGAQALVSAALIVGVVMLWRSSLSHDLKSAGLLSATVIATPYLFIYDLTLLVMAWLFLARHAGAASFDAFETGALLTSGALLIGFAMVPLPVGAIAALLTTAIVARRIQSARSVRHDGNLLAQPSRS